MKKIRAVLGVLVLCCLAVVCFCHTADAMVRNLNDDPNYPFTYGHANYAEYLDLSSCTFVYNNDDAYEFAACYVGVERISGETTQRTAYFRQRKDGQSQPQFWDQSKGSWITIPYYDRQKIEWVLNSHGYMEYIEDYHPFEYYMFKRIYQQLWGVRYSDGMD